ncbi:MAG: phosphoglycerate kinase [Candidatus Desulfacyla sp.]
MEKGRLDPRLRLIQQGDLEGKVVLLRVDHNVVKKGRIKDPYRIDATIGTLYAIAAGGGKPILMTHVGRPKDKKTGRISCREDESITPIARYLEQKLPVRIHIPEFPADPEKGITRLDPSIESAISDLRQGKIGMIYLPNTRWFEGEQAKGPEREALADGLASLADLYVNDAFGSWRAHASTYDVAKKLPSFAGILLQKELRNLYRVLEPQRPFVAVVAGAKYDTKIGPLKALYERVDHLILGGLMYNTFLAAKHGVRIAGVTEEDRALAGELVELDKIGKKIVPLSRLVESETLEARVDGKYQSIGMADLTSGRDIRYVVDVDPGSFEEKEVADIIASAKTIFVNAVMGFMPLFYEGSEALYRLIGDNTDAARLFAGGDTLQELRNLCPGIYMAGLDDPKAYYFTGGGSVLTALEQGTPYQMKPVEALMEGGPE